MSNPNKQVHMIGPRGDIIGLGVKASDKTINDLEVITPKRTRITVLNIYRVGTDREILNVAATRKSEALNIIRQLGREVKEFLDE